MQLGGEAEDMALRTVRTRAVRTRAVRTRAVRTRAVLARAGRTRRGAAGLVIGLAAVGLGIYAGFAGQPARAGNAPVPGLAVSAAAANRLDGIARGFAKANGDSRPAWINAVITTHARALASATPGDSEAAGARADVYLITMRGHFTGHMAAVPPGAKLPTGSYLSIVISARSFMVMDWGLSPGAPPVSPASLGPVRSLRA
jgi:hypothetical protein